ncbi:MAG TPA: 2-oxo-4-hydroxy-4-carboxy-5-ureidoimidazoline decarboxylase, partial [Pyrinomonadaceae bacterium]
MELQRLNEMARSEAVEELLKCCGSLNWAMRLTDERPFDNTDSILRASDRIWWGLEAKDWLEAFSHHPKIGERRAAQEVSEEARRWSEEEQSSTGLAAEETM